MKHVFLLLSIAAIGFSSCKKETVQAEGDGSVNLVMDAQVGTTDFALNKDFTIGNRTYNFKQFRYWISNVILVNESGGQVKIPNAYYLIEETDAVTVQDGAFTYPATKRETVELKNIPMGNYKAISFSIGVDSKYNDNLSLQAGELSQLNGMTNVSWMWHTTYIFSALSGTVKEGADSKAIRVETGLNNNYKSVNINLPQAIKISSKTNSSIDLAVHVDKIIDGVNLMQTPIIGAQQATEMAQVANNYASGVFTVKTAR